MLYGPICFRSILNYPPWCLETPVCRTPTRLLGVVLPVRLVQITETKNPEPYSESTCFFFQPIWDLNWPSLNLSKRFDVQLPQRLYTRFDHNSIMGPKWGHPPWKPSNITAVWYREAQWGPLIRPRHTFQCTLFPVCAADFSSYNRRNTPPPEFLSQQSWETQMSSNERHVLKAF